MRTSKVFLPLITLGLGSLITGLPTEKDLLEKMRTMGHIEKRCPYSNIQYAVKAGVHKRLLIDSMSSPIDSRSFPHVPGMGVAEEYCNEVTREHTFQPPDFEKCDQRGPCPGLNALANHAYIPRSGVVPVSEKPACIRIHMCLYLVNHSSPT
ncbi:hypothetical protein BDV38DRAFT_266108 [Aspergillus pseudotamarii]|uniref:Heme haloperoxidase family profile domain-containing protein n=1 Tax=Aspergillus pseudotamarii TaxID=132259 RepID=A0A5N6S8C3_ASPPS|nr:uncharacterized protein BDV38DRAFT_266108 [Aspergillus pseudotamarii]KAE8130825.1 hypothetical protein BDV38DRAFT_266108 [Aspergillus pseudotamarii]